MNDRKRVFDNKLGAGLTVFTLQVFWLDSRVLGREKAIRALPE
ncbi:MULTISPECIES: hypothetical protein [Acidaminococcus]|nr:MULTISPECIES: hypothetical protein [Acidaminococcus]